MATLDDKSKLKRSDSSLATQISDKLTLESGTSDKQMVTALPPNTFSNEAYSKMSNSPLMQSGEGAETTKYAGKVTSSSLDKVISNRESGLTGNTWFDVGYSIGKARKNKVEEAGGIENFRAAKASKRQEKKKKK